MAYDSDRRLNYLDDEITSRLGAINATGRGTISIADGSTTGTATIPAVVTARTTVRYMGLTCSQETSTVSQVLSRVELTNTTTITATVNGVGGGSRILVVGYEYTEYAA